MAQEKIVTLFDSAHQAEAAKRNLVKAGFSDRDISLISGERLEQEGQSVRHPSLWQRLFGHTVDKDQAVVYTRAMDKGGVVLALRTEEEKLARAMTILHSHDSVDVPSRIQSTLDSGTSAPGINPTAGKQFAGETNDLQIEPRRTSLTGDEREADILRLAEEHVEVGKRLVSEGSTRVRRYTVTDTVSEDISLHEQHADIFRRPVNEPALAGEVDWSEKTVEVAETHEQPVINKTAQVKEEVVVRTDGSDRTETINDTVRRQEVDIDQPGSGLERELPGTTAAAKPATGSPSPATHNRDHKESMTEKVSEKASEVKDKVENKLHHREYNHSH
ncbi:YsnF/AvaK domain-containing protein [Pantoea sp. NSTU24]|uniref:YsnF/AvaK domain-containing protein n=1 Tax=Pantoea sp. NSTU24 TaxID=3391144 RepID=UPI003D01BB2B